MLTVSNTTPIISLIKIGHLDLLSRMFGSVLLPQAVYRELTVNSRYADEADLIKRSTFLKTTKVSCQEAVWHLRKTTGLDAGESEAIILAEELSADLLLMDKHKGRQSAKRLGLNITGTMGLLLQAYDEAMLSQGQIIDCLDKLQLANIRIKQPL